MNSNVLNPMLVAHYSDRPTGAEAWLIVDTFLHGVAGGGIRMAPDLNETLMKQLAATMTIKLSIVEPPQGGAKCGIRYDSKLADSKEVLNRVVRAFAPFLQTCWATGSDLGTDWNDVVSACREQAGIPHPQFALIKAYGGQNDRAVEEGIERLQRGTSLLVDQSVDLAMSNAVAGWTVCVSTEEAFAVKGEGMQGKRVAIQGFGAVGGSVAKFLVERGATVIAICDEFGAIIARNDIGIDIPGLLKLRKPPACKVLDRQQIRARYDYELADRDAVLYLSVDVLIPAAGSHISADLRRVQARIIVEGANDPFTENEEELLHKRGITVVPDAIANAGGAGLYGLLVLGNVHVTRDSILNSLREQVGKMTRSVLGRTSSSPRHVLEDIARSQIRRRIREGHALLPNGLTAEDLENLESEHLHIHYRMSSPYADVQMNDVR